MFCSTLRAEAVTFQRRKFRHTLWPLCPHQPKSGVDESHRAPNDLELQEDGNWCLYPQLAFDQTMRANGSHDTVEDTES
jgi:hypothetical protein